jgi:hypothetical protein
MVEGFLQRYTDRADPKDAHLTRLDARVQADFCVGDERSDRNFARSVSEPEVRGPSQPPR